MGKKELARINAALAPLGVVLTNGEVKSGDVLVLLRKEAK